VWDDLVAGRSAVANLGGLVDEHLAELRGAQEIAANSPASLPDDLAAQHAELRDLLDAGDLVGKLARISAITSAIVAYRESRLAELQAELHQRVEDERVGLAARHPEVDADALVETMARLEQLVPDGTDEVGPEVLESRLAAFQSTVAEVDHELDVIVAKDRLFTVPISEIAPDLIRTTEDLAIVVERLDRRVAELLGDKDVRLT
jgi:hypothetical protein